jgi:protein-disulfide isomerase
MEEIRWKMQVLRLRLSQEIATNFAQDDSFFAQDDSFFAQDGSIWPHRRCRGWLQLLTGSRPINMPHSSALAHRPSVLSRRASILLSLAAALLFSALSAHAQFAAPSSGTQIKDSSLLHPPAGARVAIVEFADMECPRCGVENPVVKAAAAKYKIPWIRHDFLIPGHIWSPVAAVNARWFDAKSKALGDEYRDQVFANQASIYNLAALRQFTEKFAQSKGIALPFAIDPQGTLAAAVNADKDKGIRTGIDATPTIFIVTANSKGAPYIEVRNPDQDLYRVIDQALVDTAAPVKAPAKKIAAKKAADK